MRNSARYPVVTKSLSGVLQHGGREVFDSNRQKMGPAYEPGGFTGSGGMEGSSLMDRQV
jgi:hypothetical protein